MALRVTVELLRYGKEPAETIGTMLIANDGTSDNPEMGNYLATVVTVDKDTEKSIISHVIVHDFKRSDGIWRLVKAITGKIKKGKK